MRTTHPAVKNLRLLIVPVSLVGLWACSEPSERDVLPLPDASPIVDAVRQAQKDWPWIAGTEWELTGIEAEAPIEDTRVWISFKPDETWVAGSAGCNRFTGQYIRRGENGIQIGPLSLTRMFCGQPAGVMQQEARVMHLLGEANAYEATREWLHLRIDETIVLSFRPAAGAARAAPAAQDPPATESP